MATFTLENFIRDLRQLFVDNLNTKISAVNTESNAAFSDSLTLDQVGSSSFLVQDIPDNFSVAGPILIVAFLEPTAVEMAGSSMKRTVNAIVTLVHNGLAAKYTNEQRVWIMMRYVRALTEVVAEKWDRVIGGRGTVKIQEIPFPLGYVDEELEGAKIGGITIQAVFA